MADELILKVVLDDGSVKEGFLRVENQANKTAKNIEGGFGSSFDQISSKVKGIALTLAAAFTVNKLVNFLQDSARAASEAEKATNALSASLAQIGKFSNDAVNSFSKFAFQLQAQTGIEDDLIKQNAALLVSLGGLSGQGLERATKASLDLAQALQIDVGTAFELVAKASTGNTTALSRYGLKIDENIPKSQKFAETLQLIETRFGGLAETRLNTFEGSLANLDNAFSELQESIGGFITSSPALRAAVNFVAEALFGLSESVSGLVKGQDLLKGFLTTVIDIGAAINAFLLKPIEILFNLLLTGAKTINVAFKGIVVVLQEVASLIVSTTVVPISKVIDTLGSLASFVSDDFGNKIKSVGQGFRSFFQDPIDQALEESKASFSESFDSLAETANTAFNTNITNSVDTFLTNFRDKIEQAQSVGEQFKNSTINTTKVIADQYAQLRDQINKAVQQGIVNTISGSLQRIGASLVNGGKAFDNFGSFILNILGDLAIQVGSLLIAMGLGLDSLKVALATFNGAAAVAAGVALVVLGGALKALSGGLGAASSAPATGGGIAASPSVATELTPQEQLTRQEPGTQVSVVVQGDILDSEESGSRVVALINQAFDKKGVVINQGVFA